jgi:uncharacterized protein DUF1707
MRDMRTSERDRERVADFLRDRCAEGRLTADELAERLDAVWSSRTYGELEWLLQDLPGGHAVLSGAVPARRRSANPPAVRSVAGVVLILAAAAILVHAIPFVLALVLVPIALVAMLFTIAVVGLVFAPVLLVLGPIAWIVHRLLRGARPGPAAWGPPHAWGPHHRRTYRRF